MVNVELQSVYTGLKEMLILNIVKLNYLLYDILYIFA